MLLLCVIWCINKWMHLTSTLKTQTYNIDCMANQNDMTDNDLFMNFLGKDAIFKFLLSVLC